jgi:hypothetical protein
MTVEKEFKEFLKGREDLSQKLKDELILWFNKGQKVAFYRGYIIGDYKATKEEKGA